MGRPAPGGPVQDTGATSAAGPRVAEEPVAGDAVGDVDEAFEEPGFAAAYLNNPPPEYPRISQRRREQGTVLLRVVVGADGFPLSWSIERSSGHPRLDEAALAAVEGWRFEPARRGSRPVTASVIVPMEFRLR
jgi:periplasmic protein TonB